MIIVHLNLHSSFFPLVAYQSQVPGFRGRLLSSENNLKHTAAIRLICKMIKEPCFNELRTKQQLGYIVSSYYGKFSSNKTVRIYASHSLNDFVLLQLQM